MKILFLGLLYDEKEEEQMLKNTKRGFQAAANKFQWSIIKGLEKCDGVTVDVLGTIPCGSYPFNFKKLLIKSRSYSHQEGSNDRSIGFINLPFIKNMIRKKLIKKYMSDWIATAPDDSVIMGYTLFGPILRNMKQAKEKKNRIKTCIIQADAVFGRGGMSDTLLKRVKGNIAVSRLKMMDSFVILSKYLKEPLEIGDRPYVVVEGMVDDQFFDAGVSSYGDCGDKKIILYTGAINKIFHICDLVDSFRYIEDETIELWICGSGDSLEYILQAAERDKRIQYKGYVDKDTVLRYQNECTILVNPRKPTGTFTKYSFPSKTMEYMLSGKPVLMYKLEGIPDEYDRYLNYFTANDAEGMAIDILSLLSKPEEERYGFGLEAKQFILDNKNMKIQCQKIVDMISGL